MTFHEQTDKFVRGQEIPPPVDPFFQVYSLCKGMKWNQLPEPGGLYAQNPEFLERVYYVMGEEAKWQHQEQERQQREAKSKKGRK